MARPKQHKTLRWLPWLRGSGLFVVVSLGLHWAVLQIPITEEPVPQVTLEAPESAEPAETIDVVRLPAKAPEPQPEPAPAPTPAAQPDPAPQQPQAPLVTKPPMPQPQPSPQPTPVATQTPEPEPEPTSAPDPAPEPAPDPTPMTLDERLQTFAEYQYNDQAKSVDAGAEGFMEWYTQQDWFETYPFPGKAITPPLQVSYPLNTCLPSPPMMGMLAVIVNPDGTLAEGPILASSTGYNVLDERALEMAEDYDFPVEENAALPQPKVRPLQVEVIYDAASCTP